MKYASRILALTITLLPMLAAAQLRSSDRIGFQVPFQFMCANKTVPAGQWIVQLADMDGKTLLLRNATVGLGLFSQTSPKENNKAAGAYALVFHEYGGQYFLAGMKVAGERLTYQLHESKAEAELRAQNVPVTEKILFASLK